MSFEHVIIFFKYIPCWCLTWIQPACKLCSWKSCVLRVLSMLFLFQKYILHWCLTWIQPVCKLCLCILCVLWVWACYFCLKNSYHIDAWLEFNQLASCAHAYPVYYEFWICCYCFKNTYHTDVWLGFNQSVSCAHADTCVLIFSLIWMSNWIQTGCKFCLLLFVAKQWETCL